LLANSQRVIAEQLLYTRKTPDTARGMHDVREPKKTESKDLVFFYPLRKQWHIISRQAVYHCLITPQAIFSPAFPDGCEVKSSGIL
jgi:hypothetical protein